MAQSVYKINEVSHLKQPMFFGDSVDIQRYDVMKYRKFDTLYERQFGFSWNPKEVDITRDSADFKKLDAGQQHLFISNLKRQTMLDSIQGRAPSLAFAPVVSLPEVEAFICGWTNSEVVHSRSYSHVLKNLFVDPSAVFDDIKNLVEVQACADDISIYYDNLIKLNNKWDGDPKTVTMEHKKALWLALHAVNALEGIRFYVSFACSFAFAENKLMEGNAKIIKLIARDENLHLDATQYMIKTLPKDDPDFKIIREECLQECYDMMVNACDQEIIWADYLFKDGSMIGLNKEILVSFVKWITNWRMSAIGLTKPYPEVKNNPLPWFMPWVSSEAVQVAPQEAEISSYIVGGVAQDVSENTFDEFGDDDFL